jgi:hypothetical protein
VGYGEVIQFRWGTKSGGGWHFSGERVGGTLFSAWEKENIEILGNFGHFGDQKASKCSKIAQNSLWGRYLKQFSEKNHFFLIWLIFYLIKEFLKSRGGTTFLAERVWVPLLILTYNPQWYLPFCMADFLFPSQ